MDAGGLDVALAQQGELLRRKLGHAARIDLVRPPQSLGQEAQVRQLHGAFHLGMAGQDLLHQGRARARQAEDEDGVRRRRPGPLPRGEEGLGVERLAAPHMGADRLGVVGDGRLAQGRARRVVGEGFGKAALVLQRLAEGIVQVHAVLGRQVRALKLAAHGLHVRRAERGDLQVGQAPVGVAQSGLQRDAALVGGHGLGAAADGAQGVAVV